MLKPYSLSVKSMNTTYGETVSRSTWLSWAVAYRSIYSINETVYNTVLPAMQTECFSYEK